MFDFEKYYEYKRIIDSCDDRIEQLEKLKKDLNSIKESVRDVCDHDLILVYDKEHNIKKANCLLCGDYFELDGNFDLFSEKDIDIDNIIDVTDKVSEFTQRLTKRESVLYLLAKARLNKFKTNKLKKGLVKKIIEDELINYDKDYQVKRLKK